MSGPLNQPEQSQMAAAYEVGSVSEPAAGPATRPSAELSEEALDEAIRQARHANILRAKRKYLDDLNAGLNPVWDPAWDQLSTPQETTTKKIKLGHLKPFKGEKYSDFRKFMANLEDRFAINNIRSIEDKLRMAASFLDDNLRMKWLNHLERVYEGEVRNVSSYDVFKEWLRSLIATPSERRRRAWEALDSIRQKDNESYDKFSDRFDAITLEIPKQLDEENLVTLKLLRMRAELRERTYTLGDPVTLKDLTELARKAESFLAPIAAASTHAATRSAPSAAPITQTRENLAHPPRTAFSGARTDLSAVQCWNCWDYGHYATACWKPRKERPIDASGDQPKDARNNTPATSANQAPVARKERK